MRCWGLVYSVLTPRAANEETERGGIPPELNTAALIEALEGALEGVRREVGMIDGVLVQYRFHLHGESGRLLFQLLLLTGFAAVGRCLGGVVLVRVADKVEDGDGVHRVVVTHVHELAGVLAMRGELLLRDR